MGFPLPPGDDKGGAQIKFSSFFLFCSHLLIAGVGRLPPGPGLGVAVLRRVCEPQRRPLLLLLEAVPLMSTLSSWPYDGTWGDGIVDETSYWAGDG